MSRHRNESLVTYPSSFLSLSLSLSLTRTRLDPTVHVSPLLSLRQKIASAFLSVSCPPNGQAPVAPCTSEQIKLCPRGGNVPWYSTNAAWPHNQPDDEDDSRTADANEPFLVPVPIECLFPRLVLEYRLLPLSIPWQVTHTHTHTHTHTLNGDDPFSWNTPCRRYPFTSSSNGLTWA